MPKKKIKAKNDKLKTILSFSRIVISSVSLLMSLFLLFGFSYFVIVIIKAIGN